VTATSVDTFNFADFQGFAALRRDAAKDTPEARRAVAQQFEAMFLNLLLTQMRDATEIKDGVIDEERLRPYQSMQDQQLALTLSKHGGIGLADSILRQLGEQPGSHIQRPNPGAMGLSRGAAIQRGREGASPDVAPEPATADSRATSPADFRPASPAEFVAAVWPHAQRAAAALGIDTEVLVAQAALETGWGARQIPAADGTTSFNLFGVKATGSWDGPHAQVPTLEYVDGVPERRRETFRVYASLEDGFSDYVRLVSGRFQGARDAQNTEGYLRGLEAGGYATDPAYADKVLAILRRGLPGRSNQVPEPTADNALERSVPAEAVAEPLQARDVAAGGRTEQGVVL
jgi:flagellar protein FlgJ